MAEISKARLRWQCRRGMRELDVLLSTWLEQHFDRVDDEQKAAFQALLELPDPDLAAYLVRGEPIDIPGLQHLVGQIRGNAGP